MIPVRCVLVFFIFMLSCGCFAQAFVAHGKDTLNRVDRDSLKQGLWKIYKDGSITGEGLYRDNKKSGEWIYYHPNKQVKARISYENDSPSGFCLIYDSLGYLSESGFWRNNKYIGNYVKYYPNGNVSQRFTFDSSGNRTGFSTFYHPNGIVQAIDLFIDEKSQLSATYDSLGNRTKLSSTRDFIETNGDLLLNSVDNLVKSENGIIFQRQRMQKAQIEKERQINEERTQRLYSYGLVAFFALAGIFSGFAFYRKRKDNRILVAQKHEIEKQALVLSHQKQEITDSINYARRIQQAILPRQDEIESMFSGSFVLYHPKDIVSGDFYWMHQKEEGCFIAAADCTGHGVPGALMSMVAIEKLTEAVITASACDKLLTEVNRGVKRALKQADNVDATRDGLDIALCFFSTDRTFMEYAGANRPVWIIKNNTHAIAEIKGTKSAIGGLTDTGQEFVKHRIELEKGDTIYLFSDGYADQFGSSNKKMMTRKFKEVLLSIQEMPMKAQREYLERFYLDWKGDMEQTDDVLVIGIRL